MTDEELTSRHLDFFLRNGSGCAFAAHAAKDYRRLEWGLAVVRKDGLSSVNELVQSFVADPNTSTLSIIFPDVQDDQDLDDLIPELSGEAIFLSEIFDTTDNRCYRFRAVVGDEASYVSGFGPFDYMPITRRTPDVSLVMRVAARPAFDWHLKEPEAGIVHVADMDMKGLSDRTLKRMWSNSFFRTAGLLGHKPDQESAAKTTFVIPLERANQILT